MTENQGELTIVTLNTLHGARGLPAVEAAVQLRGFVNSLENILPVTAHVAEALAALRLLINQLDEKGIATDNAWESAIMTMLSLANESA